MKQVQILVDGEPGDALPVSDRGFNYGDGVFRTLRVQQGRVLWWPEQLARLAEDCARLGLSCPAASVWLADFDRLQLDEGVLRLTVTRGSGPRGYRPPMPSQIRRVVQFQSQRLPTPPSGGAVLRVCDLRLGLQPRLAGIKHLNRLENVLARAEWSDPAIHEGLLLDQDGWVISGCMSNLFVVRAGELHTPCLARCGVAGVTRARLMRLAAEAGMRVQEVDLDLAALLAADELFLTNSLIGLWPVARLQARTWREHPVSARCAGWLDV